MPLKEQNTVTRCLLHMTNSVSTVGQRNLWFLHMYRTLARRCPQQWRSWDCNLGYFHIKSKAVLFVILGYNDWKYSKKCIIHKYIQVYIHIYTRVYQNSWVFLGIPRNTLGSAHGPQVLAIHGQSYGPRSLDQSFNVHPSLLPVHR
jgi:hypothetical protein